MTSSAERAAYSTLDAACDYVRRGLAVVPVPRGEKAPRIPNWPELRLSETDIPKYFGAGENIGLILGKPSGDLVDVDLDSPEAIVAADFFLPATALVHGRRTKPRSHHFFRVSSPVRYAKFTDPLLKESDPTHATLVELRQDGHQTIVPPSLHPSDELYCWHEDGEPARVEADSLSRAVRSVAAAALLARRWPSQGRRNDAANALAGMLLRAGWNDEQVALFIRALASAARDEEIPQRLRDVISTAKRLAMGRTATGAPTLASIVGDGTINAVRGWLELDQDAEISATEVPLSSAPWPEPLAPEAFYGTAGAIVRVIEPHSEADPAALLLQLLISFGNLVGRSSFFIIERHKHYVNLFALVVGATSKARKGTAWAQVEEISRAVDPVWLLSRVPGGVGSGEGIIWAVRDPILKGDKLLDEGVDDKRLLVHESEFAQVLAVAKREGSTVSEVLRRAWDGTPLQILTKNSPARATGAHISLVGHITRDELLRQLDETELANGLMNRFIFCCSRRSKALPEGGSVDQSDLTPLLEKLRGAVAFARQPREMKRDDEARALWCHVYLELSEGKPGLLGAATSRAEAQVLRLSMVYALLDCSAVIRREHLLAALSMWDYAEASARNIFGDALGDPVADEILGALRSRADGLTRTDIRDLFKRNKSQEQIGRALGILVQYGLVDSRTEQTDGRPIQRWFARNLGYDKNVRNDKS